MQLRDIQYAVSIGNHLSFSKAAVALFISQPALSQSIRRLEQELGVPLFVREHNTVRLTAAGKIFVEDGAEILRMSNSLKAKMSDIINLRELHLRLGISTFYSNCYLPRIIPAFRSQFPSITLEIIEESSGVLETLASEGKVDFCMIPAPLDNDQLDSQMIYQEQILLAVPPDHLLNRQFTPALSSGLPFIDLPVIANEPFIFLKKHQRFTSMAMQLCEEAGFQPKIVFETVNWNTVNSLVANGMGIGFVPEILTENVTTEKKPAYYRIMAANTTRPYVIAYRKGVPLPAAARNFIEIAKHSFNSAVSG